MMKRQKLTVLAIAAGVMAIGLLSCEQSADGGGTPPGTALWAKSVSAGADSSLFISVAADSSGNVYAAGYQVGTGSITYGSGVTAQGTSSGNNVVLVKYDSAGTAQWAKSVSTGSDRSMFNSVAVDSSGNVYAAGGQFGTGSYTYGPGVTAQGTYSSYNVVLVKYDSNGTALWAKSVSAGSGISGFGSVAVDSTGNVYAAGWQSGDGGSYTYGPGVSAQGTFTYSNVVLVKYDSSGTAQWAKSVSAGTSYSLFYSIAVDSSGNVYAAGTQYGTGSYTYGTGVSAQGTYSSYNVVLVKYDSNGTALWAKSVSAGAGSSYFSSVTVDSAGNVYAAGCQTGTGSYTYGSGASVAGTNNLGSSGSSPYNAVLVKYDSSGDAQWARSISAGIGESAFRSIAADSSGNVYAAGYQYGSGSFAYGSGVSAQGTNSGYHNVVLVKYDSSGAAQWAKSVSAGADESEFHSVAADSSGNVYAAGYQTGAGSYTYGSGASVAGINSSTGTSPFNVVLVKYKQ